MEIKLGDKVRCLITGFEGIATAKVEYLNGCIQYGVKPPAIDGKMPDCEYIDYQQLEFVEDYFKSKEKVKTGGFQKDCPKK